MTTVPYVATPPGMNRLVLTQLNGKPLDIYTPRNAAWSVRESVGSIECRVLTAGGEEYFVKETREQIAAQVQP
jgi:hypothetical protein